MGLRETGRPDGETQVRLPDGAIYRFKMVKQFCNVARPVGATRKQLPNLLHQWFGPNAGQPSTAFDVRFYASRDGWWAAAPPSRPHQRPAPGPRAQVPRPPANVGLHATADQATAKANLETAGARTEGRRS